MPLDADDPCSDTEERHGNIWEASETEYESFGEAEGADENGLWEVEIIGEEVDGQGRVRHEAAWKNWSRKDGTNTTWDDDLLDPIDIGLWRRKQTIRRKKLASESLDIEIWTSTDIHNTATRLRVQAYDEKLKERERRPLNLRAKMERLLAEKREDMGAIRASTASSSTRSGRHFARDSSVSMTATSVEGSRNGGPRGVSSSSSANSTKKTTPAPVSTSRTPLRSASTSILASTSAKGKKRAIDTPISRYQMPTEDPDARRMSKLPHRALRSSPTKLSRRKKLEMSWRSRGAAPITIVNDVDDEEVPLLPADFRYLESEYLYSEDILQPDVDDLFVHCECKECEQATVCSCQGPSELLDVNGNKTFAYTQDGLYAFNCPQGVDVVECNKNCECDLSCPNRIAQLPRDVPIEVFKTEDRGWGVRSSLDVERGKVLGKYTGLLIRRDTAEAVPSAYCFDLDGREDPNAETPDDAYSVDSTTCGNWTRFVNHSCDPNLMIYLVVYDTIPEMNMPYIAFVALRDIPAGSEFTFDYNPADAVETVQRKGGGKGKGKGKAAIPDGAKPCRCGAESCRGWVRV